MATIGKTAVGATFSTFTPDYEYIDGPWTLPPEDAGTLTKLSAYIRPHPTVWDATYRAVLYLAGTPLTLVASSEEVTVIHGTADAWFDFPVTVPLSIPGGDYYVGLHGAATPYASIAWDADMIDTQYMSRAYASGPAPTFTSEGSIAETRSLYATLAGGSGGGGILSSDQQLLLVHKFAT